MDQITPCVYCIATPMGEHFVNAYIVVGEERVVLVDTGIRDTFDLIVAALEQLQIPPKRVTAILITHGHPDHIGSNHRLQQRFNLPIIAPHGAVAWIEDHERQFQEFPAAFPDAFAPDDEFKNFWMSLMDGETQVDMSFDGALTLRLGESVCLASSAYPGHSAHETGYLESSTGCLLLGDAIALDHPAGFLAYVDPVVYRQTLQKINNMLESGQVNHLLAGHYPPLERRDACRLVASNLRRIEDIEQSILSSLKDSPRGLRLRELGEMVARQIDLTYNFQTPWTISGHLKRLQAAGQVNKTDSERYVLNG